MNMADWPEACYPPGRCAATRVSALSQLRSVEAIVSPPPIPVKRKLTSVGTHCPHACGRPGYGIKSARR